MRKTIQLVGCLLFAFLLSACASERMRELADVPPIVATPQADKATVVFLRPSFFGGAIQSSVFDISDGPVDLVGIVSAGRKIAYGSRPGQRRFMVVGESADFMNADLTPGKTYFARVEPRIGFWKARFTLVPVSALASELEGELKSCTWVDNTPDSFGWAKENMPSIQEKLSSYLPDWEKGSEKPFLKASDGK